MRKTDRRLFLGLGTLVLAIVLTLGAVSMVILRLSDAPSNGWVFFILAGPPEVLCLVAVAILGKENSSFPRPGAKIRHAPSLLRHYCGLAGLLFNSIPLYLYAYVPDRMPGGSSKYSVLVIADIVFIGSLILAGGDFWEKVRRLFIPHPSAGLPEAGSEGSKRP